MTDKAKADLPWYVTVIFVPLIGFMGLRMVNSIDSLTENVGELREDMARIGEKTEQNAREIQYIKQGRP